METTEKRAAAEAEELLNLDDAVQFLGTSKATLYRLLKQGDLKGLKVGRQWRFRRADLVTYMERAPEAEPAAPTEELDTELEFFAQELSRVGARFLRPELAKLAPREDKMGILANWITLLALTSSATDFHLEPFHEGSENFLLLRLRISGALQEVSRVPFALRLPLTQRFKRLAGMDPVVTERLQEGRFSFSYDGTSYQMRVSCLPTGGHEALTVLIPKPDLLTDLDQLGLTSEDSASLRDWIRRPHGLMIATGPVGSGRTTLLYRCLQEIAGPERKTLTSEDPPDHPLPHTTQVRVDPENDVTFASALRAFAAQAPDIVLVGDLRDQEESAALTLDLAFTGRLVLTATEAGSAAAAVQWLLEMELEPPLLAKTLIGVVAQRLARRLCPACKEPVEVPASDPTLARLRQPAEEGGYSLPEGAFFFQGRGCEQCRHTGYQGQIGLFEVMSSSPSLADAILRRAPAAEITRSAVCQGTRTLIADGLRKAAEGVTTLEELLRVVR
jgi:excisionase family DNA binding protein